MNPFRNRKSGTGNPPPTAGAPVLDPTGGGLGEKADRTSLAAYPASMLQGWGFLRRLLQDPSPSKKAWVRKISPLLGSPTVSGRLKFLSVQSSPSCMLRAVQHYSWLDVGSILPYPAADYGVVDMCYT